MTISNKNILIGILLIIAGALFIIPLFHILAVIASVLVIIWGIWLVLKGIKK